MPVSILLVKVCEGCEENTRDGINALPGAEVTESGNGYLVAATDSQNSREDFALIEDIQKIEFVTNVSLIMTAEDDAV